MFAHVGGTLDVEGKEESLKSDTSQDLQEQLTHLKERRSELLLGKESSEVCALGS